MLWRHVVLCEGTSLRMCLTICVRSVLRCERLAVALIGVIIKVILQNTWRNNKHVVCSASHKTLHPFILLNHFQPTLILKTFHLLRLRFQSETPDVRTSLILSDNYHLPLLAVIPLRVWAVG